MAVRIGIDVGGTFTDAVAIDNDTYELIGSVKTPTTHAAAEGVAAGIVQVLHKVMEQCHIAPEDVVFIAHGTTQATNALLEGDVAKVGVITLGKGLQGAKSKGDTTIGNIELAQDKYLVSQNAYVDTGNMDQLSEAVRQAVRALEKKDAAVLWLRRLSVWMILRMKISQWKSAEKKMYRLQRRMIYQNFTG